LYAIPSCAPEYILESYLVSLQIAHEYTDNLCQTARLVLQRFRRRCFDTRRRDIPVAPNRLVLGSQCSAGARLLNRQSSVTSYRSEGATTQMTQHF